MHDGGQYPGDGSAPDTTGRTIDAVLEFAVETMALVDAAARRTSRRSHLGVGERGDRLARRQPPAR